MAKNANFVSHKKSKQIVDGKPKLPLASDLVEGEIAINFGKDVETLSIKNESGDVVTFSSDNYYTEQKLGSGFTGENSGVTVTEALENIEITVDQDFSNTASTNPISTKAVYSAVTDNELVWTNAFVALSGTVSAHTEDTSIHVTSADKAKLHTHTNKTYLDSITGNVGTMAYQNANSYSSATEVSAALSGKANTGSTLAEYGITNAYTKSETSGATELDTAFSGKLDESEYATFSAATNTSINDLSGQSETVAAALNNLNENKLDITAYTPTDLSNYYTKSETSGATELTTAFSAKANTTDIANFFDDAKYEDSGTTKVINFYHGNAIKATIDASDFIVDGMVDDVKIENGYLVIDFNTASGKQDISIPLTDIFDPSNYYNKTAIDNLVGSGFTSSSITDVIIENEEIVSNALTDLDERKLDASAYTPTDLSNYYTKSETSGKTEISTALGTKVNSATFTGHTADTSLHFTTTEKTNLDSLATNIAAISGITSTKVSNWDSAANNSHTHSNKTYLDSITGNVGTMAYQATSSYSSATQVNTALAGKSDTSHTHASSAVTAMTGYAKAASGSSIATGDTLNQAIGKLEASVDDLNSQSETVAAALVDLSTNKLDASALTEVNSAISDIEDIVGSGYTNTTITAVIENMDQAVAAAITDLNDKIGDIESILATI